MHSMMEITASVSKELVVSLTVWLDFELRTINVREVFLSYITVMSGSQCVEQIIKGGVLQKTVTVQIRDFSTYQSAQAC